MVPDRLYKFERLNQRTLQNLKNAQIYFNTPASFNDPFDCSILEASVLLNDESIVEIFNHYKEKFNISIDAQIKSIKDIPEKNIKEIQSGIEKALKTKQEIWLHKTGCTCFSEKKTNLLMWSHYSDGHKGICLEFDTSFAPFSSAMKVNYLQKFPSISPMRLIDSNDDLDDEILKPLLTKFECWSYEYEWRVFHNEPNKSFGYDVNALKAVYFGENINKTNLEIVCLILQGQCKDVKFFKTFKDKSSYLLRFEEFFYSPHIKAKT